MESINLTQLIEAIITIIFGLVVRYTIPWIKGITTEKQQANIKVVIQMLVEAAEQMFKGEGRGEEKLAYVKTELEKRGIEIDLNAIESTVYKLKNQMFGPLEIVTEENLEQP